MTAHVHLDHGDSLDLKVWPDENGEVRIFGDGYVQPVVVVHAGWPVHLTTDRLPCDLPHHASPWWVYTGFGFCLGVVAFAILLVVT